MPILNNEETTCANAASGCRATSSGQYPGTGRVSDIVYESQPDGYSNLYIAGRESEGPIQLTQFHRNCHQCPHGVLITQDPE